YKGALALASAILAAGWGSFCRHVLGQRFVRKRVRSFEMMIDLDDRGISRTLLLFGRREEEHMLILRRFLRSGMTVFDIGANIGYYVLIERDLIGEAGHIVAIEPSPSNVELLRRNLELNAVTNVTLLEMGVSNRAGQQTFHLSHQSNLNTFHPIGSVVPHLNERVIEVEIESVPGMVRRVGRVPDLIRMDVEGHEVEIIEGLLPAIEAGKMAPMILFETHLSRYTAEHDLEPTLRRLLALGYKVRMAASSSEIGTQRVESYGYRGEPPFETDLMSRAIFENIATEDAIELICKQGGLRAVLLARP
ncbi:MAG: FkbM family methyltransferase, partial [Pseudorhodoplanes sp.]|nr:FkbM family methyltransferase [Pseudorhodoplanes sp.]